MSVLAIETASSAPTLAIQVKSMIYRKSLLSDNRRYDSAFFVNYLADLLDQAQTTLSDLDCLVYCAGPGQFSPLRVASLIARLLFRLNPGLKVYRFNLTYLLFWRARELGLLGADLDRIHLASGPRGFFEEAYDLTTGQIALPVRLVPKTTPKGFLLNETDYHPEFELADFMIQLLQKPDAKFFRVSDLSEIIPNYVREASVSQPKQSSK